MSTRKNKADHKKTATRVICLAIVIVMLVSTLVAALLSQVW